MSKLSYPSTGVYPGCSTNINAGAKDLSSAIRESYYFDIPNDFAYKNYLNGLYEVLSGYGYEIANIGSQLRSYDSSYGRLSDTLEKDAGRITVSAINKRGRLVK